MKKQQYLDALLGLLTAQEIRTSATQPSAHMTRMHVLLHYVALRRLGQV